MGFLRSLVERGLFSDQLAIWQRCIVHFMCNGQGKVIKSAQGMVTVSVRTIFNQPDHASAVAPALPPDSLATDPLGEPSREAEQGKCLSRRRGGHLPESSVGTALDRDGADCVTDTAERPADEVTPHPVT